MKPQEDKIENKISLDNITVLSSESEKHINLNLKLQKMIQYVHSNVENHEQILKKNKIGMDKQKNIFTELFDEINKVKNLNNTLKLQTTEQIELINLKIDNLAEEQNEIRKEFSIFE